MKAVCPNNENHKEFITTAHVMQDWKVDDEGNWIETIDASVQTSHKPDPDNIWTCSVCNKEAKVNS
jgi:hypothetical protein